MIWKKTKQLGMGKGFGFWVFGLGGFGCWDGEMECEVANFILKLTEVSFWFKSKQIKNYKDEIGKKN